MLEPLTSYLPDPLTLLDESALRQRSLSSGETLFHQGDVTRGLFFLREGSIHLQRVTESGHDVLMLRASTGETFAEASLFHEKYHCSALAKAPCDIIECSKVDVLDRYREDAEFSLAMCARFASQVQHTRSRLELFSIRSADERVFRAVADGMLKDSVKTFSTEIGLSQEVTYRSLSSLVKAGRIQKLGYGRYAI